MATAAPAKPSLVPAILALVVLLIFGYILFMDLEPGKRSSHELNPPIEIIDDTPPLTVISEPDTLLQQEQEADAFVSQLASETTEAVTINEHDAQFVRHDSTISIATDTTSESETISLAVEDIVQDDTIADDALFYIHRVTPEDVQGLWGIVQAGLIRKFRQGLRIEGVAQNKEVLQAIIPADADEPLPTGLSSFLGKILADKVNSSYIYNFKTKVMGRDANLIYPGQQVIVIHFTNEELKQIYQFFAEQRNQDTQTFAID